MSEESQKVIVDLTIAAIFTAAVIYISKEENKTGKPLVEGINLRFGAAFAAFIYLGRATTFVF